jgi:hypothetical protein
MTSDGVGKAEVGEAALTWKGRKEGQDKTASQEGGGPEASLHADPTQDGEPGRRQLQQQLKPKPKPKLPLTLPSETPHKPKPKPIPTPGRWLATV